VLGAHGNSSGTFGDVFTTAFYLVATVEGYVPEQLGSGTLVAQAVGYVTLRRRDA
jgi:hypothetical protein